MLYLSTNYTELALQLISDTLRKYSARMHCADRKCFRKLYLDDTSDIRQLGSRVNAASTYLYYPSFSAPCGLPLHTLFASMRESVFAVDMAAKKNTRVPRKRPHSQPVEKLVKPELPSKKMKKRKALVIAQEIKFARLLANNDKKVRDKMLKNLKKWLTVRSESSFGKIPVFLIIFPFLIELKSIKKCFLFRSFHFSFPFISHSIYSFSFSIALDLSK